MIRAMAAKRSHSKVGTHTVMCLAITVGLVGCGSDKSTDTNNLGINPKYQGSWQGAFLNIGKADPEPYGCLNGAGGGVTFAAKITNYTMTSTITEYIDDKDCKSSNTLTSKGSYVLRSTAEDNNSQSFRFDSFSYEVIVRGDATVRRLNSQNICGRSDWQQRSYTNLDAQLAGCTEANTADMAIPNKTQVENAPFFESKFQRQGKGLALSSRDTRDKDSKFSTPSYFAR